MPETARIFRSFTGKERKNCHKLKLFLAVFDMVCYNH